MRGGIVRARILRPAWIAVVAAGALVLSGLPAGAAESWVGTPVVQAEPTGEWIAPPWVDISWTVDHQGADLAGYAVLVDDQPESDPGTTVTDTEPVWYGYFEDGVYWLHVRAILSDGSFGEVAHARIGVDGTPPAMGELSSSSHPAGAVSPDPAVVVSWAAPEDLSGVVGYQVTVTDEGVPPGDDETIDTTNTTTTLTVPGDGAWTVNVRARDGAGLWSPYATYDVAIDTTPPGAPTVAGSHQDGVPTSQRHVVMKFSEASDQDHVQSWTALIDQSPTTTPPAAAAKPEAQIATDLTAGDWWLHVAGVDSAGRLGQTRHVLLSIQQDPFVVDVPANTSLWAPMRVPVTCATADGARVVAIAEDGTSSEVGGLDADGEGSCAVVWDVTAEDGGARTWPDGTYQLVVAQGDVEVSERVTVVVATASTATQRLRADYSTGWVDSEEFSAMLLQAAVDPAELPAEYQSSGADDVPPTNVELVSALTASGTLSESAADLLTPTEVDENGNPLTPAARRQAPALTANSSTAACAWLVRFINVRYDCVLYTPNFVIHFDSLSTADLTEDGESAFVSMIATSLERARRVYAQNGFAVPGDVVEVFLDPGMPPGTGVSLPTMPKPLPFFGNTPRTIILNTDASLVTEYLPDHEFFHQVEYQYTDYVRVAHPVNSPYWWMEACAEWGAHLVQQQDDSFQARSSYASYLKDFIANSRLQFDRGEITTPGGPEYGAFVMAEYLSEEYGGPSAIEETWQAIGTLPFATSPAGAIERVMRMHGDSYASGISRFREWMYPLGRAYGRTTGFSDPDAQTADGFWRRLLDESTRPPHDSVALNMANSTASGTVSLSAGGAQYVEITGPADAVGVVQINVTGPNGQTGVSTLADVGDFPSLCPYYPTLASSEQAPRTASATQTGSVQVGGGSCGNAVLVITNTQAMPAHEVELPASLEPKNSYTWSMKFIPLGTVLNNGTIAIGVHDTGALGFQNVGIVPQSAGWPTLDEGWGVSDGTNHGGTSHSYYMSTDDTADFAVESISYTATTAETIASVGDLLVTHSVHPSTDPDLYAIDVTVQRPASSPAVPHDVVYRRTAHWSMDAYHYSYLTWAPAAGGNDTAVAALTDSFSSVDPVYSPNVWTQSGYVDHDGPVAWEGHTFDVNLGVLAPGQSTTFTLYYGVSATQSDAAAAVSAVGADVYALVEATPSTEIPTTGVFAYRSHAIWAKDRS